MRFRLVLIFVVCSILFTFAPSSAQTTNRQAARRDSFQQELKHAERVVDSLRAVSDRRFFDYDSAKEKVQQLEGSGDTALLHHWTRLRDSRQEAFDAALTSLDYWVGKMNQLRKALASLPSPPRAAHKKLP